MVAGRLSGPELTRISNSLKFGIENAYKALVGFVPEELLEEEKKRTQTVLDEGIRTLRDWGFNANGHLAVGEPVEEICRLAKSLSVDLIVVGDRRSDKDELKLPHPRAHERAFVLKPWHDLEPDAVFPERGPIAELLGETDASGVRKREDLALEAE